MRDLFLDVLLITIVGLSFILCSADKEQRHAPRPNATRFASQMVMARPSICAHGLMWYKRAPLEPTALPFEQKPCIERRLFKQHIFDAVFIVPSSSVTSNFERPPRQGLSNPFQSNNEELSLSPSLHFNTFYSLDTSYLGAITTKHDLGSPLRETQL